MVEYETSYKQFITLCFYSIRLIIPLDNLLARAIIDTKNDKNPISNLDGIAWTRLWIRWDQSWGEKT